MLLLAIWLDNAAWKRAQKYPLVRRRWQPEKGKGKVRLLTRQSLDGRTKARKQFDAVVTGMPIPMKIKVIPVLRMTNWKRKPLPSARPPPALD